MSDIDGGHARLISRIAMGGAIGLVLALWQARVWVALVVPVAVVLVLEALNALRKMRTP